MKTYETWVHGTSGQVEPSQSKWGTFWPFGWGLHLEGNIEDDKSPDQTWVHFHIPLPALRPEAPDAPSLQKVMLRFATDCNKPGWFVHHPKVQWKKGVGGTIIRKLHLYDGESPFLQLEDLDWQSENLGTVAQQTIDIDPDRKIQYGLGISTHVRFLNQLIVDWKVTSGFGGEGYKPGWEGLPFVYADAATKTKGVFFASVGCRYSANM